jgi:hypothetical protein
MAKFLECSVPEIEYLHGRKIVNHPVNINLCVRIRRDQHKWYPDNEGLPSIHFDGCNAEWVFKSYADRDADYERVLKLT